MVGFLYSSLQATTIEKVTLETDEAAISCCCCEFEGLPLLIVGTVTAMTLRPKKVGHRYSETDTRDKYTETNTQRDTDTGTVTGRGI